jgi:hypothetical protein
MTDSMDRAFSFLLLNKWGGWAHIEHCGSLSIGVIYFTDKDTEGGRHQRSHRSSPRTKARKTLL